MNPTALHLQGFHLTIRLRQRLGRRLATAFLAMLTAFSTLPAAAVVAIDNTPLSKQSSVPGNLVLVPSVEWPTVMTQANDPGVAEGSANYSTASVTSCPAGYTLVGSSCQQSVPATVSCPDGYELNGGACQQSAEPIVSCPTNFSQGGSNCTRTKSSGTFTSSECSNFGTGYTRSNSNRTCSGPATYSCPVASPAYVKAGSGTGTTCTRTGSGPTYSCPTGTASGSGSSMICITATATPTTVVPSYAGYFNSNLCYAYKYDAIEANRYFYPVSAAASNFNCEGKTHTINLPSGGTRDERLWSGNYLNWVSMQAIDTFRLALTGGYRVHRPAEGTPPNVNVVGSNGTSTSWATSEMPDTTYLEKANSDRWDDSYVKLRRLASGSGASQTAVRGATPYYDGSTGFRARIGALRNQMWFAPTVDFAMGAGRSYNDPRALALPITSGDQDEPGGATGTGLPAVPYNPAYHTLPSTNTSTYTNGTACGVGEPGCSTGTPLYSCSTGTLVGTNCSISTTAPATPSYSCPSQFSPSSGVTATTTCTRTKASGTYTSSECSNFGTGYVRSNSNRTCSGPSIVSYSCSGTLNGTNCTTTTLVPATATPQYVHTTYGKNQVYAVSIRVKVCDGTLDTRDLCTLYGSNYKPEGLLQKNARKIRYSLFSYVTETGQQRQGGVMRARQKLIGPLSAAEIAGTEKPYPDRERISGIDNPEWDPATGVFLNNPDSTDATATSTNIGSCTSGSTPDGSGCQIRYSGVINYLNRFGQILTGQPTLKSFDNLSELYYTSLRYLRGLPNISSFSDLGKLSSSDLVGSGAVAKYQNADGLPVIDDWYKTGANTAVTSWETNNLSTGSDGDPMLYQCQTTVVLGIGDTATQSEDDSTDRTKDSGVATPTWRGYTDITGTPVRGLVSGLAYWAHLNDLRSDVPNNDVNQTPGAKRGQTISTYWVDVVERNDLLAKSSNQYYNATKYGGYTIPDADWGPDGNATRHDQSWFDTYQTTWTSKTSTIKAETGLGGTGDFLLPNNMYLANNGQKMIAGLNSAFQKISEDLLGSGASLAANSTKLDTDTTTYQAVYYTGDWRGDLKAFPVGSDGEINATTTWEASKKLALLGHASRKILTCTGSGTCATAAEFKTGVTFDAKADLGADADNVIDYLRGSSTNEVKNGGTLRNRASILGDIVNSQPVFVAAPSANLFNGKSFADEYLAFANEATVKGRTKVLYVAANDGMLHAFNAVSGVEEFAYLPRAVIKSGIRKLSQPTYGEAGNPHQFWNDGELVIADVQCAVGTCPNAVGGWATVLVGTTGRGPSKAVYALDVTDPADPRVLWERSAGDGVTGSNYIGQVIGKPVIARLNSTGTWAVLMGNGFNSSYGKPALLQFNIAGGGLSVYTTTGAADDGLSPPAVWISDDTVVDNISTTAYAGDRGGNVWSFTLAASGGGAGTRIFTAESSSGEAQPITAGLIANKNPDDNQVWVFFGTGEFLSSFKSDDGVQTWYGLIVEGDNKVSCSGTCSTRDDLVQRRIMAESPATNTQLAARGISVAEEDDMEGVKGWYIDLLLNGAAAETGERMVTPNQFRGSLLIGTSRLPTNDDPCNASGGGWIMAIDPFTGSPPSTAFFDINDSGTFTDDFVTDTDYVAAGIGFSSIPNNPIFVSNTMLISFDNGSTRSVNTRPNGVGTAARLSWRELVVE